MLYLMLVFANADRIAEIMLSGGSLSLNSSVSDSPSEISQ